MKKTDYTEKLHETLYMLPIEKQYIAEELIEELGYMRVILDDIKSSLTAEGATNIFVNGQQTNSRQTPEFKSYMDLSNRYKQYMSDLLNLYPKNESTKDELDPQAQLLADFMTSI